MNWISQYPWLDRTVWTVIALGIAYGVGHLLRVFVVGRVARLARRTRGQWDDVLAAELKRRVPVWCLLIGAWIALGHWELAPNEVALGQKVLFGLGGLSVTLAAASVVTKLFVSYSAEIATTVPVSGLTQNLTRIVVISIGALVILRGIGVDITPMLTALGVGGLAVALALQEPLSNLFAGLFLSLAGQVRIGDYVKLDSGLEGYIVDVNWRSTRLRMLANNLIVVPNAKLSQSIVTNYHLPSQDLAVLVNVGVDYGSDLAKVERVTCEVGKQVMQEVTGGIPEFDPFIRYHTFADSSINFTVILRGKEYVDQYLIKHEFVKRLHARYDQEGIVIPWPIRTLAPRDPIPLALIDQRAGGPAASGGSGT